MIETDHKALKFLQQLKWENPKLMKWAATLQEYNCKIVYHPGHTNVVADTLSKCFEETEIDSPQPVSTKRLQHPLSVSPEVGGGMLGSAQPWLLFVPGGSRMQETVNLISSYRN